MKKLHSKSITHELPTKGFYERYWQNAEESIPTKDPTTSKRLELLFCTLKKTMAGKKVLDAGCGVGFFTNAIYEAGFESVGMDISEKAISEAHLKYPGIQFQCNALDTRWPFEDGSFDVVFSTEVIEHIHGIYEMFAEMNRVLKKEGMLILTTPYHGLIKNLGIMLFGFDRHFNNIEGGHIRFFTKKFLNKLLDMFGFEVLEIKYIGRIRPIAKSIYMVARKIKHVK